MKPKVIVIAAVAIVVVVGGVLLANRKPLTDEELVGNTLADVSEAVEREWVNRIVRMLDEDYSDDMGNSRASLRSSLAQVLWGPRGFSVYWNDVEYLASDEDTIQADLYFEAEQRNDGTRVSTHTGVLHVTFIRRGRALKVLRVEGLKEVAESVEATYG